MDCLSEVVRVPATRVTRPFDDRPGVDHTPQDTTVGLVLTKGEYDPTEVWVRVVEGMVTGYESVRLEYLQEGHPWTACAGCHKWDRLDIPGDSITQALRAWRMELA